MIVLTGGTGSLGSYLVEVLLRTTSDPLCLLVRNRDKLCFPYYQHSRVQVIQGDLLDIRSLKSALAQARILIHGATAWGGPETFKVNLQAPLQLLDALGPDCEAIYYFSTASILQPDKTQIRFDPLTLQKGTDYIRSKAACALRLQAHSKAAKCSVLYPTVIVGGDVSHHWTPLTRGLDNLPRWLRWGGRFLRAEGAFHWIHAADIACLIGHWISHPDQRPAAAVLGQPAFSVNEILSASCRHYGLRYAPRLPLETVLEPLLWMLAPWMNPWDRYTLKQRRLVYPAVRPETYGLSSAYTDWSEILSGSVRT